MLEDLARALKEFVHNYGAGVLVVALWIVIFLVDSVRHLFFAVLRLAGQFDEPCPGLFPAALWARILGYAAL